MDASGSNRAGTVAPGDREGGEWLADLDGTTLTASTAPCRRRGVRPFGDGFSSDPGDPRNLTQGSSSSPSREHVGRLSASPYPAAAMAANGRFTPATTGEAIPGDVVAPDGAGLDILLPVLSRRGRSTCHDQGHGTQAGGSGPRGGITNCGGPQCSLSRPWEEVRFRARRRKTWAAGGGRWAVDPDIEKVEGKREGERASGRQRWEARGWTCKQQPGQKGHTACSYQVAPWNMLIRACCSSSALVVAIERRDPAAPGRIRPASRWGAGSFLSGAGATPWRRRPDPGSASRRGGGGAPQACQRGGPREGRGGRSLIRLSGPSAPPGQ